MLSNSYFAVAPGIRQPPYQNVFVRLAHVAQVLAQLSIVIVTARHTGPESKTDALKNAIE